VAYLTAQGVGGLAWWILLMAVPAARRPFVTAGAPEATLLAFVVADLVLYVGGSLAAAYGLLRRRSWAWPVLCIHAGAAAYAALYVMTLAAWTQSAGAGAVLMAPSAVVPLCLCWWLRPGR
jgi:hypothetical protein